MAANEGPRLHPGVETAYGDRIRVRVGALIFDDASTPSSVLLVEHEGLWDEERFWTPAGGGVRFGETLAKALEREVREETGLAVAVGPLRYVLDFVRPPLHAVAFHFAAEPTGGTLRTGTDPERGAGQLIRRVRFVPFAELSRLTIYPEGLAERLPLDAASHFAGGTQYLGTLR